MSIDFSLFMVLRITEVRLLNIFFNLSYTYFASVQERHYDTKLHGCDSFRPSYFKRLKIHRQCHKDTQDL